MHMAHETTSLVFTCVDEFKFIGPYSDKNLLSFLWLVLLRQTALHISDVSMVHLDLICSAILCLGLSGM